jgi:hypothetical protein
MTPHRPGHLRHRVVAACLAIAAASLATELVCIATPVRADAACSSVSACPRIEAVSPSLITAVPTRPLDVTLHGSGLTGIRDATLMPGGTHLRVVSPGETSMTVEIPVGALARGQSYRVQISVGTQANDLVQSPPFGIVSGAGAQAPVSLEPAPTVPPTAKPVVRAIAQAPATPPTAGSGGSVLGGILIWLLGLLLGSAACLVFAVRTGLIRESRWASLVLDHFAERRRRVGHPGVPAEEPPPAPPPAPRWTLAPAGASLMAPAATQDRPIAEPAPAPPAPPSWGIREQTKPDGAAIRFRTPPL